MLRDRRDTRFRVANFTLYIMSTSIELAGRDRCIENKFHRSYL